MVIARKIAYNVVASSISKLLSTVLALVSIGFITRYLGTDGFGDYATVLAFLSFFAAIADLGLYSISTREISRHGADEEKIIGNIFSLRLISSLAVFIISPAIIMFFPYPAEVKEGILIAVASFVFSSGYQVLNGVFQKNLAMDKVALGELIGKAVQVVIIIFAVKLRLGFNWIIASLLINMIINFLIVFLWSRKYIRFKLRFDFGYWKKFLKEAAPIGIGSAIVFVYFKIDTIFLSVMKNAGDVGIYNAAYKVLENITFFPAMIVGLVLPIMSNTIFHNKKRFKEVADNTIKFFVILVVPMIIGTLFLSEGIINLIGGGAFGASANVLRVLVFALTAIFFGSFFNNILIAGNRQKKLLYIWSFAAVINIVLNLIFIPKFSYFAAAYVSVLTETVVAGAASYFVIKELKYFPEVEKMGGILFSGIIMAVFLLAFRGHGFFLPALSSALVYFVSLWAFQAVKSSEITSIITKKGVEEYEELP